MLGKEIGNQAPPKHRSNGKNSGIQFGSQKDHTLKSKDHSLRENIPRVRAKLNRTELTSLTPSFTKTRIVQRHSVSLPEENTTTAEDSII